MQVLINGLDCLMSLLLLDLTVGSMGGVCRVWVFFRMREKVGSDRSIILSFFLVWKVTFAMLVLRIFLNSEGEDYCLVG